MVWIPGIPYEKDCYLGLPDSNPKLPDRKPTIYHKLKHVFLVNVTTVDSVKSFVIHV